MRIRLAQMAILLATLLFWIGVAILLYHVMGLKVLDVNGRYD